MTESEKKIVKTIRDIVLKVDISNKDNISYLYKSASANPLFMGSVYGQRFIQRLKCWKDGSKEEHCIFCGKQAKNQLLCLDCMTNDPKLSQNEFVMEASNESKSLPPTKTAGYSDKNQIEELFRDIDDSLLQVASQNTVRSIKKLTWITLGLTIFNTIAIFFLVLFLWKFMMSA